MREIKLEVLNITNTVKVRGPITHAWQRHIRSDPRAVRVHALTQLMFRMTF